MFDLIPSNTGVEDPALSNLIIQYNEQVMEYLRLTRSTNENNPFISQLKNKILLTRQNILQTITNIKKGTEIKRQDIIERNKYFSEDYNIDYTQIFFCCQYRPFQIGHKIHSRKEGS